MTKEDQIKQLTKMMQEQYDQGISDCKSILTEVFREIEKEFPSITYSIKEIIEMIEVVKKDRS